jgi:RNA polymerase sigma-70 factor (ECF subfamily)
VKIIPIHKTDRKLIRKVQARQVVAQKQLFEKFSPRMLSVCRQYVPDLQRAEDVMMQAFVKVFDAIQSFDSRRPLQPWIKRIMINEAISFLRKEKSFEVENLNPELLEASIETEEDTTGFDAIQYYIDQLPEGYRVVFVLYVVEGYKHKEIAELLKISEGTSKSQLHKARTLLKQKILIYHKANHE